MGVISFQNKMASHLDLGHGGAGGNCFDKTVEYFGKGVIAGNMKLNINISDYYISLGGFYGAVEACFLPQQPRSTTPLLYTALRNIGGRGLLGGKLPVSV